VNALDPRDPNADKYRLMDALDNTTSKFLK